MSVFNELYSQLSLKVSNRPDEPGLRRAQLGAAHAIAAHFSLKKEQAIVVMPTGAGKTAVLFMAAILLRANRCLVITPSQMVRTQIAEGFASLDVLRGAGVLPPLAPSPKVQELRNLVKSVGDWAALREVDVVVTTPLCVSPGINGVSEPPRDLFDLVLVDEAHHSPADSWSRLLDHYSHASRVLFTATPFRRDNQDLHGRFIYTYSIREAYQDEIFGRIRFVPVDAEPGAEDVEIARRVEELFNEDRQSNFAHRVMVRTDTKTRAEELKEIYEQNTRLRLAVIHSGLSLKYARRAVEHMGAGTLDGVICVSMLGEGFDFPNLKIAAIHAPHKSLAVTLQFVGRFARVTAPNLGEAKFVAVPRLIDAETKSLYSETAVWQEIVQNLSAARVEEEAAIREVHQSFEGFEEQQTDVELPVSALTPFCHVKIFNVAEFANGTTWPTLPAGTERTAIFKASVEQSVTYFVTRRTSAPEWTDSSDFGRTEYDLHVVYYYQPGRLLFINSSRRWDALYESFAGHYSNQTHRRLALHQVNRVLHGLTHVEAFNIGMRNRTQASASESYRTLAGPAAQRAVSATDGRLFHRGHVFVRGETPEGTSTLGYSSGSKVWTNRTMRLGEFVIWCRDLGIKLNSNAPVVTGSNLDILDVGEPVSFLPKEIISAVWRREVFETRHEVIWPTGRRDELVDCSIEISQPLMDGSGTVVDSIPITIRGRLDEFQIRMEFAGGRTTFVPLALAEPVIEFGDGSESMSSYLNTEGLQCYLADFSSFDGVSLFRARPSDATSLGAGQVVSFNWRTAGVTDIGNECRTPLNSSEPTTIQDATAQKILSSDAEIVIYDHRSGEIADFISVSGVSGGGALLVNLYHCKGSGGGAPGNRVSDLYEVSGQVAKCVMWLTTPKQFLEKVKDRIQSGSRLLRGTVASLERAIGHEGRQVSYRVWLVQPGFSASDLGANIVPGLQAADSFFRHACGGDMRLMCSP